MNEQLILKDKKRTIRIPNYTLAEELINAISHGIGGALSIAGLVLLIIKASTVLSIVSVCIYGSFTIILYVISCIYHALSRNVSGKKVLRLIDHCNVLLMVAGTYTPICLCLFKGTLGWLLFSVIWIITIITLVFNVIDVDKYQILSVICNLVLGWGILLFIKPLLAICPLQGIILLILGGIMYSLGAILYVIGSKHKYMHSIFHFFVIAGSLFHYFMIYFYVI